MTVDVEALQAATAIAEEFRGRMGSEIKRADKAGFSLIYKLEDEEQIGRGTMHVARVRLIPEGDRVKRVLKRMGSSSIEGRADYLDHEDCFDAIKGAVDVAFQLADDAGVL